MLGKVKFQDKGKKQDSKLFLVEIEATRLVVYQPGEMPQLLAKQSKDNIDFSLKDLSKSLCPMHEYSIGHAELKIHAHKQGDLKATIEGNMISNQCIHKLQFVQ